LVKVLVLGWLKWPFRGLVLASNLDLQDPDIQVCANQTAAKPAGHAHNQCKRKASSHRPQNAATRSTITGK
jgi:hypothetical protein